MIFATWTTRNAFICRSWRNESLVFGFGFKKRWICVLEDALHPWLSCWRWSLVQGACLALSCVGELSPRSDNCCYSPSQRRGITLINKVIVGFSSAVNFAQWFVLGGGAVLLFDVQSSLIEVSSGMQGRALLWWKLSFSANLRHFWWERKPRHILDFLPVSRSWKST